MGMRSRIGRLGVGLLSAAITATGVVMGLTAVPEAQQETPFRRPQGFIGGTVDSTKGREAGVWVIAQTKELATPFYKIVVTDDQGRFMLPEMPNATYDVWVRGYGLVDSKPVTGKPGQTLALKTTLARTPQEAAKVYPANHWYSMLEVPAASEFPGKGADVNGIPETFQTQSQFIDQLKQGCQLCHQLGNELTRGVGHMKDLGFKTSLEAWNHRVQTGQRGSQMDGMMKRLGPRALKMYVDWTDRIAAGEVPPAPERPKGIERGVVVTMWDWGNATSYQHDEVTTAKANPRINANGKVYAVDAAHGNLSVVDPNENSASVIPIPTRDDPKTMQSRFPRTMPKPSNFWGEEVVHAGVSDPHNPMMDIKGRIWSTSTVSETLPDWCKDGTKNKFAAYFPATNPSSRQASYYDPKTGKFELIYTCFGTHHLQFGEDPNEMLYFSGGGATIPWVNTKMYDETKDEQKSTGWCPIVLDTNGDGKITKPWNEPVGGGRAQSEGGGGGVLGKFDPKLDTRINAGSYGIIVSPTDHAVWAASTAYPGRLTRLSLGSNPPETCISELYTIPTDKLAMHYGPRGIDVDRNGVIWTALSGSGGFASFDRRKCKVFGGPKSVDGQQCSEGWEFHPLTVGPNLKGTNINADFHYYNWVDQFNTSGLGANFPISTGSGSDSLQIYNPQTKQWVILRVPYPLGFYSRGLDGRIDDPNAGWKGRGLWANYGTNFLGHIEGGKGTTSKMVHFQIRPDPLAR
jgi:streptogramin lyase